MNGKFRLDPEILHISKKTAVCPRWLSSMLSSLWNIWMCNFSLLGNFFLLTEYFISMSHTLTYHCRTTVRRGLYLWKSSAETRKESVWMFLSIWLKRVWLWENGGTDFDIILHQFVVDASHLPVKTSNMCSFRDCVLLALTDHLPINCSGVNSEADFQIPYWYVSC